jgi:hypothetical protein
MELGFALSALLAITGRPLAALRATARMMVAEALLGALAFGCFLAAQQPAMAALALAFASLDLLAVPILILRQGLVPWWLLLCGVAFPAAIITHSSLLSLDPLAEVFGPAFVHHHPLVQGVAALFLGLHGLLSPRWSRWRARLLVAADRRVYDECWAACRQADAGGAALARLCALVGRLAAGLPSGPVLQRCPAHPPVAAAPSPSPAHGDEGREGGNCPSSDSRPKEAPCSQDPSEDAGRAASLEQLFPAAAGLDVFLRAKVIEWVILI